MSSALALAFLVLAATQESTQDPAPPAPPVPSVPTEARPTPFVGRTLGTTRKERSGGAAEGTERALLEGLRWLIRHQNPDGSWSAGHLAERCDPDARCYDTKEAYQPLYDEGATALALLGFLQTGYTPASKQTIVDTVRMQRHKIGEGIDCGLRWLAARQAPDGHVTQGRAFLYNEALVALAFTEVYARTRDTAYGREPETKWKEHAQRSIDFLQAAQRPSPDGAGLWGWRYVSRAEVEGRSLSEPSDRLKRELSDADTSVTSWCARALGRAREAGLDVRPEAIEGALAFARWATSDNGMVGYVDPRGAGATVTGKRDHFKYHPSVMSALAMSTRMDLVAEGDDPFLHLAAKQLANDSPRVGDDRLGLDYYYWQAGTRALVAFDGPKNARGVKSNKYWSPWSKAVVEGLLACQDTSEKSCRRGGWVQLDRWAYTAGPIYTTAINVMTLSMLVEHQDPWWRDPTPRARVGERARLNAFRGRFGPLFTHGWGERVVLLDFWSPWQQGYAEGVAARAELVRSMKDRPFALAGVGYLAREGDEPYIDRVEERLGIWDTMLVEELEHRILADHDVRAFPTLIVVDGEDVIRMRDGAWAETVEFVERLVRERETKPK